MVQLLGAPFQEVLHENWSVPIRLTSSFRQKTNLSSELGPSVTHFLAVNMNSAANNTQKIREKLACEFSTTPVTSMRKGLDSTIACLCFCKVTGTKVQGYKMTNIVAAATVICGSGIASSESPIMDYLYVVPKFRDKGFARALVNFAMIMGVVHGSPYPKLYLVAEKFEKEGSSKENLAWRIYTEKYAFKAKAFGSLPANVTRYIRHCNYAEDDQGKDAYVTPLLREGLLVRSTESTMSRLACPHNASREKQLEKAMQECCLPDGLFRDSLQEKGCVNRLNRRRSESHQSDVNCICWKETVYRGGVYQIASRVFYFMQIACDNFNSLLSSRPSDPAEAVQQLGQMILELRKWNHVDAKYSLPQRDFLQCVLDKWGGGSKPPVAALDDDNVLTSDKTTGGCSSDVGADRTSDLATDEEPVHAVALAPSDEAPEDRGGGVAALATLYREKYRSLHEAGAFHVRFLDTYQGRVAASTNGCTVIAPLLAVQHFTSPDRNAVPSAAAWGGGLPDDLINQVIDEQAASVVPAVRGKLDLGADAFIIPSDVHDFLIDEGLLSTAQFVGVCGGNILDDDHLATFRATLLLEDARERARLAGRRVAATLFFHGHVVALHVVDGRDATGTPTRWVELIDSLPDPTAWTVAPPSGEGVGGTPAGPR